MPDGPATDPVPRAAHLILGIPVTATPEEARAAYLDAVRLHPPDGEPERFRELHTAMRAFCEPLALAEAVFESPPHLPDLRAIIKAAAARPPRLPTPVLLAFGNLPQDPAP